MTHPSLQEIREAALKAQEILEASRCEWYPDFEIAGALQDSGVGEEFAEVDAKFISLMSPTVVLKLLELPRAVYDSLSPNPLLADLMECVSGDAVYVEVDDESPHRDFVENTAEAMREAFDAR